MRVPFLHSAHNSREIARNRLKLVLIADKLHSQTNLIDLVRDELAAVLSRYMEIDTDHMSLSVMEVNHISTLYASIPIRDIPYKGII